MNPTRYQRAAHEVSGQARARLECRLLRAWLLVVMFVLVAAPLQAAEITSNGTGGGLWSSPGSWLGGKVPGPTDEVVVRKYDILTFDRNDTDKVSCKKLQIDPKGVLQFKTSAGKLLCVIDGTIENFGIIKLDGTRSTQDDIELRLSGIATPAGPHIKLAKGSALLLYGKPGLKDGRKNVAVTSELVDDKKLPVTAIVDMDGQVAIDWQRARLTNVKLFAKMLDNTGAKQNERLQVIDCQFQGQGRIYCSQCDTPILGKNTFDYTGSDFTTEAAITTSACALAEIKGNHIRGRFGKGIYLGSQTDSSVVANMIDGCEYGIQGNSVGSTMIKGAAILNCDYGIRFDSSNGVVEDVTIDNARTAFGMDASAVQMTNIFFTGRSYFRGRTVGLSHTGVKLSLLNCNFRPKDIFLSVPTAKENPLECQQYVIVAVKDAPEGAVIDVRTVSPAVPKDVMDPNVRNAPAALVKGKTPGTRTLNPLVVKSWSLDLKGTLIPPPQYQVFLLGTPAKEGDPRPVLKMVPYTPALDAVRLPDDDTPTLEVSAK